MDEDGAFAADATIGPNQDPSEMVLVGGGGSIKPGTTAPPPHVGALVECMLCISDFAVEQVFKCSGENAHTFCKECVASWTSACCNDTHVMQKEVDNTKGVKSPPGAVPCPCFMTDGCSDGDMNIDSILPKEVKKVLDDARIEIRVEERIRERVAAAQVNVSPVERAFEIVKECMLLCHGTACPSCSQVTLKGTDCVHMTCPNQECKTSFCYACGWDRTNNGDICGCVAFFDQKFGWGNFAMGAESGEEGAHMEFLRRKRAWGAKMASRFIKAAVWQQMVVAHPDMFQDVLPNGRHITQQMIKDAVFPYVSTDNARLAAEMQMNVLVAKLQTKFSLVPI